MFFYKPFDSSKRAESEYMFLIENMHHPPILSIKSVTFSHFDLLLGFCTYFSYFLFSYYFHAKNDGNANV